MSKRWWDRWLANREERLKNAKPLAQPQQPTRNFLPIKAERKTFRLESDGKLIPVETA